MTRLAFVQHPETLDGLDADLVVASTDAAHRRARELGRECLFESETLVASDVAAIQRSVADHRMLWAERWLGVRSAEWLGFEGFRLDEFVDYELTFPFVEIFSALAVARNLVAQVKVKSVVCDSDLPVQRRLIELAFRQHGVPAVEATGPCRGGPAFPAIRRRGTKRSLRRAREDRRWIARARASEVPVYLSNESAYTRAVARVPSEMTWLAHSPSRALELRDAYFAASGQWTAPGKLAALRRRLARAWAAARVEPYRIDGLDVADALRPLVGWLFTGVRPERRVYRSPLCMSHAADLPAIARALLALGSLLRRARPRLVLLNQDNNQAGAIAAVLAQRLGIPSLVLQHGVTAEFYPLRVDRMLLWGEAGREFYLRHGEDEARLAVVGNPLAAPPIAGAEPARVVTFISQPYTGLNAAHPIHGPEAHVNGFLDAAARWPEHPFIVRPHVLEDEPELRRVVAARSLRNVRIDRRDAMPEVFRRSRLIVVHNSTVGLEALQSGRRVLMINFTGRPDLVPYAESPHCVAAHSPQEFADAIRRELSQDAPHFDPAQDPCVARQIARTGDEAVLACHEAMRRAAAERAPADARARGVAAMEGASV